MSSAFFHRTRIAPTPSGYLHLGNAYSFALTAKLAAEHDSKTLLRIDDLDRDRVNPAFVQDVFDTLNFLEIPWQEGPQNIEDYTHNWSQMHRLNLYNDKLLQLRNSGKVFACDCSRAKVLADSVNGAYPGTCVHKGLSLDAPGTSWRLDTCEDQLLRVNDIAGGVTEAKLPLSMQYFVVRKKDGYPAYQLSSLVDDLHFQVNLIVRGADLWDSTLAQLYLAKTLGEKEFENAFFCHHLLKTEADGTKLSKSAGATSIQFIRKQGATKRDILDMLGLL